MNRTPGPRAVLIAALFGLPAACRTAPAPTANASPDSPPIAAATPDSAPAVAPPALREVFPGVRIDAAARLVEFDAILSPMLVPDPRAPLFFLETIACTPDTREHETLVVSRARPSHIHAALLLIGLTPGSPGAWKLVDNRLQPVDAAGDEVLIRFAFTDAAGRATETDPSSWIVSSRDREPFAAALDARAARDRRPGAVWVFAGSQIVTTREATPREVYSADESGTVIGLTSFGTEVVSLARTISPDAGIDEPEWIVRFDDLPAAGSPIVVRIRPAPTGAGRSEPPAPLPPRR